MKRLFSISICLVVLFLALGKSVLVLNYQINKKAIAETRCENKDKPEMHCEGACYLSKQLKQTEEKENPIPNLNRLKELSLYIVTGPHQPLFYQEDLRTDQKENYTPTFPPETCPGSIFRPPEA